MTKVTITDKADEVATIFDSRADRAMGLMVRAVKSEAKLNTPADTGQLRRNVSTKRIAFRKHEAKWEKEYASVQEAGVIKGTRISNYTTPGTGPGFAERAAKKVVNDGRRYMKQAGLSIG